MPVQVFFRGGSRTFFFWMGGANYVSCVIAPQARSRREALPGEGLGGGGGSIGVWEHFNLGGRSFSARNFPKYARKTI